MTEPTFDEQLAEVERSLFDLKERYLQVTRDRQQQQQLVERQAQLQGEFRQVQTESLKAELKRVKEQLEALEIALESQLFSWQGLKEAFWMAVRFGGLGVILGWLLKSIAG